MTGQAGNVVVNKDTVAFLKVLYISSGFYDHSSGLMTQNKWSSIR
jgi:hypothetical protein